MTVKWYEWIVVAILFPFLCGILLLFIPMALLSDRIAEHKRIISRNRRKSK